MTDDTLEKLREWLRERRDNAADSAKYEESELAAGSSDGMAYAYDDVLDWLDRYAKSKS